MTITFHQPPEDGPLLGFSIHSSKADLYRVACDQEVHILDLYERLAKAWRLMGRREAEIQEELMELRSVLDGEPIQTPEVSDDPVIPATGWNGAEVSHVAG